MGLPLSLPSSGRSSTSHVVSVLVSSCKFTWGQKTKIVFLLPGVASCTATLLVKPWQAPPTARTAGQILVKQHEVPSYLSRIMRDSDPLCGTDRGTRRLREGETNIVLRGGTVPPLNTSIIIKCGPQIEAP